MKSMGIATAVAALFVSSAALADATRCPALEPGTRYPWQTDTPMRDDLWARVALDVDRGGYPIRCRVEQNNYPDAESRVIFCKQYYDRWRGPPATVSDPPMRTLRRYSNIPGPHHDLADKRARKAWFAAHPEQRPECYPEPSRPDRLDL